MCAHPLVLRAPKRCRVDTLVATLQCDADLRGQLVVRGTIGAFGAVEAHNLASLPPNLAFDRRGREETK